MYGNRLAISSHTYTVEAWEWIRNFITPFIVKIKLLSIMEFMKIHFGKGGASDPYLWLIFVFLPLMRGKQFWFQESCGKM